jgi:hypothetical protein
LRAYYEGIPALIHLIPEFFRIYSFAVKLDDCILVWIPHFSLIFFLPLRSSALSDPHLQAGWTIFAGSKLSENRLGLSGVGLRIQRRLGRFDLL